MAKYFGYLASIVLGGYALFIVGWIVQDVFSRLPTGQAIGISLLLFCNLVLLGAVGYLFGRLLEWLHERTKCQATDP